MKESYKTIIKGLVLVMLVAVIGTTYAFFSANITGNETASTIVVTGGTLSIAYENKSGNITVNNIYPKADAWVTKQFTVTGTNTTDLSMGYKIGLAIDNNTFSASALTYSLTGTNTAGKGTIVANKTNQPIGTTAIEFGTGSFPNGSSLVHTYQFQLFFKDTGSPQNDDQGKKFAAHITIVAV